MKIRLQSDFRDYYDHMFCGSWETPEAVFERFSTGGLSRPDMLAALAAAGLRVPRHGRVRELVPQLRADWDDPEFAEQMAGILEVVVHVDERAHAGEGKLKLSWTAALAQHPEAFAVEFLPTVAGPGSVSLRHLRVGRRQFWLRYTSDDDWRSNCGEGTVEVLCEEFPRPLNEIAHALRSAPLVAVDFLQISNRLYAIDLNTAPGLVGTGIEQRLAPAEVLGEINYWFGCGRDCEVGAEPTQLLQAGASQPAP